MQKKGQIELGTPSVFGNIKLHEAITKLKKNNKMHCLIKSQANPKPRILSYSCNIRLSAS